MCEHDQMMRDMYADFDSYLPQFCGDIGPHGPHEFKKVVSDMPDGSNRLAELNCLGIMCDYGCNAEEF